MLKLASVFLVFLSLPCFAIVKTVTFVTYEAPPFGSPSLPDEGAIASAFKRTCKKAGYECKLIFAPLKRAKVEAQKRSDVAGYLLVPTIDLQEGFVASKSLYRASTVIVERKDKPIHWKELQELGGYHGAIALQYAVPPEMNKFVANKTLEIIPDDALSLLMLAKKRLDYVLSEPTLFKFLMQTDSRLEKYKNDLQVNSHVIEIEDYRIAFKKNSEALQMMKDFEKVANREEFTKLVEEYLSKLPQDVLEKRK